MAVEIKVPPLGESVAEAGIGKWYKNVGESVKADELLVELETDKVTLEVFSPCAGTLQEIMCDTGSNVIVNQVIGKVLAGDIKASASAAESATQQSVASATSSAPTSTKSGAACTIASPSASKIASENSINLDQISGTGKDNRITKGDVLASKEHGGTAQTSSIPRTSDANREERIKMTRLRQTIAKRLKDSQNTAAILTTFNEIDMSEIMRLRKIYQEKFLEKHGVKLGFMSIFVKAVIQALKEIPAVNAEIDGDYLVYKNYYDIGMAVGTPNGLVVPIVRDADSMSLAGIEKAIADLGKRARDGKLSMNELSGGTFSITNGGIYGSLLSTPIINPPQSGILGMHNIVQRPCAVDGQVVIRPMMYVALSYDHRIIDGKEAVTFLVRIKEMVEKPERILLDM